MKIKSFSKNAIKITNFVILIIIMLVNLLAFIPVKSNAASYNQVIINANENNNNGISAFPESYKVLLNKLVDETGHTNWKFKAFYTDIDWNEMVNTSNENACYRNTILKGNDSRWYCSAKHTKKEYGGDGYYCASGKIVKYYLDPRNSLTETTIFQFLDLSNSSPLSVADIQKALNGSFMQGNCSTGESYAQIIYDASAASGESALSIITKIFQEIGKNSPGNPPKMASGTDSTYPHTYNFYNYGATDGTGAVTRGLAYANNAGWHSERTAIVEGAKLISNSYIKAGQNTKYTFKFDVVGSEKSQLYTHQYMTNVQDPTNQAKILFDKYTNNGWLDGELTFIIPVYKNMPTSVKKPSNLTRGNLYYISSSYNSVGFRSGPGTGYTSLGRLNKDIVVNMIEENAGTANGYTWSKVSTESGQVGYVAREYLTQVNTKADTYSVPSQPADNGNNNSGAIKPDSSMRGDVNEDGKITASDYVIIKDYIMGDTQLSDTQKIKADYNGDGKVTASDYVLIKDKLMGD